MLSTHTRRMLAASAHRLGHGRRWWWQSPSLSSLHEAADATASSGAAQKDNIERLPDAVLNAWWSYHQRRKSEHGGFAMSPACIAGVLSRVPTAGLSVSRGVKMSEAAKAAPSESCSHRVHPVSSATVGELFGALLDDKEATVPPKASLEALVSSLHSCSPLLLRLDTSSPVNLAALAKYCDDAVESQVMWCSAPAAGPLHMHRMLRQITVSWQPWVTSTQKARLMGHTSLAKSLHDSEGSPSNQNTEALPNCTSRSCGSPQDCQPSSTAALHPHNAEEDRCQRSWSFLLEHVPPFFVAASDVRASLLRSFPTEGVEMWQSWLPESDDPRRDAFPSNLVDGAASGDVRTAVKKVNVLCTLQHRRNPYLEWSRDGSAVRAPSDEHCLQAGCPARLLYGEFAARRHAVKGKYSLLHSANYGPHLMHYATSLLAATVPTTPCSLTHLRQLFATDATRLPGAIPSPAKACAVGDDKGGDAFSRCVQATVECRSVIPCVEVLLNHPDLAFAICVTDAAGHTAHDAFRSQAAGLQEGKVCTADDTTYVRLHPAFAHPLRGTADAALRVLLQRRSVSVHAATSERDSATYRSLLHVHHLRSVDDLSQPAFQTFLHVSACETGEQCGSRRALRVVHVSDASFSDGTDHCLFVAVACDWRRVDVLCVGKAVLSAITNALSSVASADWVNALSKPSEESSTTSDDPFLSSPPALRALLRLLCSPAVIRILPEDLFHSPPQRDVASLLHALPVDAIASLCSLQHVVCYTGYPVGRGGAGRQADRHAEAALAAVVNQRHDVCLQLSSENADDARQHRAAGNFLSDIVDSANVALAASLLLRDEQEEREAAAAHLHQEGGGGEKTTKEISTFREWVHGKCGLSRGAQHDYAVARRLSRYLQWLQNDVGETGAVAACFGTELSMPSEGGTGLSTAARREALQRLTETYGPEPFSHGTWMAAEASTIPKTNDKTHEVSSKVQQSVAASAANAISVGEVTRDEEDKNETTGTDVEDFSVDANLYDALLRDAAAARQTARSSSTTQHHETAMDQRAPQECSRRPDHAEQTASNSGGSFPSTASSTADSAVEPGTSTDSDTLQFYLSTLLSKNENDTDGSVAAASAAAQTQPSNEDSVMPAAFYDVMAQPPATSTDVLPFEGFSSSPSFSPASEKTLRTEDVAPRIHREARPLPSSFILPRGFGYGPRQRRPQLDGDSHARDEDVSAESREARLSSPPLRRPAPSARHAGFQCTSHATMNQQHPPGSSSPCVSSAPPHRGSTDVARFDPFAAWTRAPAPVGWGNGGGGERADQMPSGTPTAPPTRDHGGFSNSPPPPVPPVPPPTPLDGGLRGDEVGGASCGVQRFAVGSDATSDFLGRISEAERLRLASLIVDILKGSSRSPPPPPRKF